MSLTIGEVLSREHLHLDVIVAGDLAREIRWVHATDMPDPAPYLRGNELVLTAGIWYWQGTAASSFAASLGHVGAAGLGFGINPLVDHVPEDLIHSCRGWDLTLFSVPPDVAFIQIAEEFVEAEHLQRERDLLASVERSGRFVHSLQTDDGLAGLLRVLWRLLPRPAAIVERRNGVIAAMRAPAGVGEAATALDAMLAAHAPTATLGELSAFAIPIVSGEFALVIEGPEASLAVPERAIIDQALAFIAIELQRQRAVMEGERRFVGELFDLLGAGEGQVPAVAARLRSLGLDPGSSFCGVACRGSEPETIRESLSRHLAASGRKGAVAIKAVDVVAIVQVWPGEPIGTLAEALHQAVGDSVAIGVGGVAHDVHSLSRSVIEADQACQFAERRPGGGLATIDALASHAALVGLQNPRVLAAFHEQLIEPLEIHDRRRGSELIKTLSLFLGSGGRFQQTADELHVHVNTLRLRLERIEQLTGRDLGVMDDRVDLWIALRSSEH